MMPSLMFALLAAVIPAAVTIYLIWRLDRYEREPAKLVVATIFWGALPAVLISLALEQFLGFPLQTHGPAGLGQFTRAWLVSPVVEEIAKGLALIGLYLFVRIEIDDILDGIVYGALVGVGFAMTENFLYFLGAAMRGDSSHLLVVGLVRGVLFGLNHSFYAAISGIAIALAATRHIRGKWLVVIAGLAGATLVHMLHNITVSFSSVHPAFLILGALLNWGGIVILIYIIAAELYKERTWIERYLASEVPLVISASQYELLRRLVPRTALWSALLNGKTTKLARLEAQMEQAAHELAFHKHRLDASEGEPDPNLSRNIELIRRRLMALGHTWAQTH